MSTSDNMSETTVAAVDGAMVHSGGNEEYLAMAIEQSKSMVHVLLILLILELASR